MSPQDRNSASLVWAVSTLGRPEATLADWQAIAARWSFHEIELRVLEGSLDVPTVLARRFGEPFALRSWLKNQPASIGVASTGLRLAVDSPVRRAELLAFAPWAEAAGTRWLRVFDDVGPSKEWSDDDWLNARRNFAWWREQRATHAWQVDLIVEAHHAWYSPAVYRRATEELGQEPPLIFDLGHALRSLGAEGALAAWETLARVAPRVHFKDATALDVAGPRHCLPGSGVAPLAEFLASCRRQPTIPVVTFEWERHWEPDLPDLDLALTALRDRFRS